MTMKVDRAISLLAAVLLSTAAMSCATLHSSSPSSKTTPRSAVSELKMQSLVMDMADEYIASLGESVYLLTRSGKLDSKGRWLAESFLRNGVGASLDIAVGPNPAVNLLDLLVLSSLQAWSFNAHWIPAGIGDAGIPTVDRLKRAEAEVWASARKILSKDQMLTLRGLIKAWMAENSDRTVVALVRFEEFSDKRRMSSMSMRGKAQGLLREVGEASAAVDDVRLLGERLIWFAGRYPYLLGEQTELTAYRLLDQPESAQLMGAVKSIQGLSEALTKRIGTIQNDLEKQQAAFFSRFSAERTAAVAQAQAALEATIQQSIDRAAKSINAERGELINQLFERLAKERQLFLDDIGSRKNELLEIMTELRETISASEALAKELTETASAVDRVLSQSDKDPESKGEPFRMADVRDAAGETGRAAERLTRLLDRFTEVVDSKSLDNRISSMTDPLGAIIDQAFWRGVVLICLLIVGLALVRLVPQRKSGGRHPEPKG